MPPLKQSYVSIETDQFELLVACPCLNYVYKLTAGIPTLTVARCPDQWRVCKLSTAASESDFTLLMHFYHMSQPIRNHFQVSSAG